MYALPFLQIGREPASTAAVGIPLECTFLFPPQAPNCPPRSFFWKPSFSSFFQYMLCHSAVSDSLRPQGFFFFNFNWRLITLQYCSGFCHTLTWISHGCTCFPHPETPSHLPPHPIPQGHPSTPALSTLSHALNLDWWSVSHMVIYMFQCYSLKSSHPLLPQSPKDCSINLCLLFSLFCI